MTTHTQYMDFPPFAIIDTPGLFDDDVHYFNRIEFLLFLLDSLELFNDVDDYNDDLSDEQNTEKQKPQHFKAKTVLLKKTHRRPNNSLYNFRKKKMHR